MGHGSFGVVFQVNIVIHCDVTSGSLASSLFLIMKMDFFSGKVLGDRGDCGN